MTLSWTNPLALALGLLIVGPILAHLIRQTPRARRAFGAMLLIRRLPRKSRRRNRVQDPGLMWLRIAMVGLAGLAAAAPQLEWPGAVPEFGGSGAVVVVMDDSLSMGLEEEATLLARARSQATAMVRSLPAGTLVGVVRIAGTATRATPGLIDEPEVALAAITATEQTHLGTDLVGGIRLARQMLAGEGGEVVVFTDEAGLGVVESAQSEIALLTEQGGALVPKPVHAVAPANVAVLGARYGSGPEGGSVAVTIANYGDEPVEVPANLALPDGTTISAFVTMEAGQTVDKTFTVPRVTQGGVGIVQIEDGKIAEDNVGSFHLPTIGASRVLVVDGDPGLTPTASEVYYLERALAPWGRSTSLDSGVLPDITAPSAVQSLDDDVHRVVFMSNVADPGPWANRLVEFVSGGGSLVISLGDNVSADRTNAVLAKLLPTPLRRPRSLAAQGELGARTALPEVDDPIFSPFVRGGLLGFQRVRWSRLFSVEPFKNSDEVRTLLQTEGGMPVLIERRVGMGRVLLFTGSLDVDWGNFPLQAVYMPLIQSLVRNLGIPGGGEGRRIDAFVGQPVEVSVSGHEADLVVDGPEGRVDVVIEAGQARFTPTLAGAFSVGSPGLPPIAQVAVNVDGIESDVRRHTSLAKTAAEVDPDRFMHRLPLNRWALLIFLVLAALSAIVSHRIGARSEVENAA